MSVTDKLSRRLHETLGDEAAEDMVDWMHRMDGQRAELRELNELNLSRIDERFGRMDGQFARIDERFQRVDERFARIDERFQRVDERFTRIDDQFVELRREMDVRFAQFEASIIGRLEAKIEQRTADLMKWSFVFWCGAVAAIAALAGVLK
jgi:predicted nuclease with TOPRIM domain